MLLERGEAMTLKFYNRLEAAAWLRCHPRHIYTIVSRLKWKIGPCGVWLFTEDDLRKMATGGRR